MALITNDDGFIVDDGEPTLPDNVTAFATPLELSNHTNGQIAQSDPRAQLLLDGATRAIQNYVGWNVAPPQDLTVVLDGGTPVLYLPSLRVNSITSVTVDGTSMALTDIEWSRVSGNVRQKHACNWPDIWGGIAVTFNSGYASIPADLKEIVLQVVALAASSPMGATREQAGQVSMAWATTAPGVAGGLTLLERDLATLSRYILPKEA